MEDGGRGREGGGSRRGRMDEGDRERAEVERCTEGVDVATPAGPALWQQQHICNWDDRGSDRPIYVAAGAL